MLGGAVVFTPSNIPTPTTGGWYDVGTVTVLCDDNSTTCGLTERRMDALGQRDHRSGSLPDP